MSIGIRPGEIHGLIGENGAGRSGANSILSVGRLFGISQPIVFLKKGCPNIIRWGNTVWYVVV